MKPTAYANFVSAIAFFVFIAMPSWSHPPGQRKRVHQFTITLDNDLFMFKGKDRYYTNGSFFNYDKIGSKTGLLLRKRIYHFELGQLIYVAHSRKIWLNASGGINQIDRPITGYLFGKVSQTLFYKNNSLLKVGFSIGTIGKNSFAKQIHTRWHDKVGVAPVWNWVWDYQLKSELGFNLHGCYAITLFNESHPSFLQITPVTTVSLGTTFTTIDQSVVFQIGKFNTMAESGYWSSRLQNSDDSHTLNREFFFFYKPLLQYQVYNATIQGGMFRDDKGPITSSLMPLVVMHEFGLHFSTTMFTLGYSIMVEGKRAKSQISSHSFASIRLAYRL